MRKYVLIGVNLVLLIFGVALFIVYSQDLKSWQKTNSVGKLMEEIAKRQKKAVQNFDVPLISLPKITVTPDVVAVIGEKNLFHKDRNSVVVDPAQMLPPLPPVQLKNPPLIKYITRKGEVDFVGVKPQNAGGKGYPDELKVGDFWEDKWRVTSIDDKGFNLLWDDPQRAKDEEIRGLTPQKYEEFITKPSRQASGGPGGHGGFPANVPRGGGGGAIGQGVVTINGSGGGGGGVVTIGSGGTSGGGRMAGGPVAAPSAASAPTPAVKVMSGGGAGGPAPGRPGGEQAGPGGRGATARDVFGTSINSGPSTRSQSPFGGASSQRTSPFNQRRKN